MPDEVHATAPPEPPTPSPADTPTPLAEPADDWATRYKYLLADFENFRRRTERSREAITRQARAGVIRELLPIFEAFRSARVAVASLPGNDPVRHGLEMLDREWSTFLKHEGVEPIAVVGEPFRPDEEEAVGDVPTSPGVPDGGVAEIVQQGYRFFGGVLRPAKVVVARAPPVPVTEIARPEEAP
ncbi:MAG TPA: nucleotide exchange factor GrpE [Thermoplasmata archaeon]|nr:nucleotide exchange factor GrpE [Thermoplasmata archaeon]